MRVLVTWSSKRSGTEGIGRTLRDALGTRGFDAVGFPASAIAKTKSGDWRNPEHIRAWADQIARELPGATPLPPVKHPARSVPRLLAHAIAGWALCAMTMTALLHIVSLTAALVIHAAAAPLFFTAIAWHYFRLRGAQDPLPTAAVLTVAVALLDLLVVAVLVQHSLRMFASLAGTWLPFALIFLATWATGLVMSVLPESERRGVTSKSQAREKVA